MKYYLTFEKTGGLRYISHLDTMRLFQRTFRRAKFRLRFSEGFNPHPKMSFAQPLSLGYIGLGEVLEFEMAEPLVPFDVPDRLNPLLPPGVKVTDCRELPEERKTSLSALTESASYDLYLNAPVSPVIAPESLVSAFLAQESIQAEKRIKKTKQMGFVEIRPLIRSFAFTETLNADRDVFGMEVPAGWLRFHAVLATGPVDNLNPEVLLRAFAVFADLPFDKTSFRAVRESLSFRETL